MSIIQIKQIMQAVLKFLHLVLVAVTISGVIYTVTLVKGMYDFVKETRATDHRQDESLAKHIMLLDTRQQKETDLELKNTQQDGKIETIMAILNTIGK